MSPFRSECFSKGWESYSHVMEKRKIYRYLTMKRSKRKGRRKEKRLGWPKVRKKTSKRQINIIS